MVGRRKGFTLAEILVTVAVAAVLGVPLLAMVGHSDTQTVVSEDYMFAEALAQRQLEMALSKSFDEIAGLVPVEETLELFPTSDEDIVEAYPAYRKNLSGDRAFRGYLAVTEPAEGLYRYVVKIAWPTGPTGDGMRYLVLVRFRCLPTKAMTARHRVAAAAGQRNRLRKLP